MGSDEARATMGWINEERNGERERERRGVSGQKEDRAKYKERALWFLLSQNRGGDRGIRW